MPSRDNGSVRDAAGKQARPTGDSKSLLPYIHDPKSATKDPPSTIHTKDSALGPTCVIDSRVGSFLPACFVPPDCLQVLYRTRSRALIALGSDYNQFNPRSLEVLDL